ncbi:MAG: hypothetical protein KC912_03940 [Proteobacteria bacterium]|nr:hypothetical protein [Pseudomonadota bacterium]
MLRSSGILVIGSLFASSAFAAEPVVASQSDGTVVGSVVLNVTPEEAMDMLGDAELARSINPDVVSLQTLGSSGPCTDLDISTRGMWRPLKMKARRCRTTDGFRETLIESADFDAQEATWTVSEHPEGALLEYSLKSEPNLPVPRALIQDNMRKSVKEMLGRFVRKLVK